MLHHDRTIVERELEVRKYFEEVFKKAHSEDKYKLPLYDFERLCSPLYSGDNVGDKNLYRLVFKNKSLTSNDMFETLRLKAIEVWKYGYVKEYRDAWNRAEVIELQNTFRAYGEEQIIQLELIADTGGEGSRLKGDYDYLIYLKKAAYNSYLLTGNSSGKDLEQPFQFNLFRFNEYGKEKPTFVYKIDGKPGRLHQYDDGFTIPRPTYDASKLYPPVSNDKKDLLKYSSGCHGRFNWLESSLLLNLNLDKNRELALANAKPVLKPYQLLSHYQDKLTTLTNSDEQRLFDILFFSSQVVGRSNFYSTIPKQYEEEKNGDRKNDLIGMYDNSLSFLLPEQLKEKTLCDQCNAFIKKGIEQFTEFQPSRRVDVHSVLFFIRFANHLRRYNPEAFSSTKEHIDLILGWLKRDDLQVQEKIQLHLQLINEYRSLPPDQLKEEEILQVMRSWSYACNHPVLPDKRQPVLEHEDQDFVIDLLSRFGDIKQEKKIELVGQIMVDSGLIDDPKLLQVKESGQALYEVVVSEGDKWEIDLVRGESRNANGALRAAKQPEWKETKDKELFKELFGNEKMLFKKTGNTLYFHSDKWGAMRIVNEFESLTTGLQRQINGKWHSYIPLEPLEQVNAIPKAILHGNTAWGYREKESCHLILSSKKEGINRYSLNDKGEIHPIDKETGQVDGAVFLSAYSKPKSGWPLSSIENESYIVMASDAEGNVKGFEFPQYDLSFSVEGDKIIWKQHPEYVLDPKQPSGLFGKIHNYVVVMHKEGKGQKVIVPHLPIRTKGLWQAATALNRSLSKATIEESIEGVYSAIVLDLVEGQPVSKSVEGNLALAYLHLSQKDPHKALACLKKISSTADLSDQARQTIRWMVEYPDATGIASAVKLHALVLEQRYLDRVRRVKKGIKEYDAGALKVIGCLLDSYQRYFKRIPIEFEIPHEMLSPLLDLCKKSFNPDSEGRLQAGHHTLSHTTSYLGWVRGEGETIDIEDITKDLPFPNKGWKVKATTSSPKRMKRSKNGRRSTVRKPRRWWTLFCLKIQAKRLMAIIVRSC